MSVFIGFQCPSATDLAPLQLNRAAKCIQRHFKGTKQREAVQGLRTRREEYGRVGKCPACGTRYADAPVAWVMKPVKDGGQGGSTAVYFEELGLWKEPSPCCGVCRAAVCGQGAENWWKSGQRIPEMLPVTMGNCLRYQIAEDDEGVQVEEIWETRPKPDAVHWVLEASQLQLRANGKVAAMGEEEEEEEEE